MSSDFFVYSRRRANNPRFNCLPGGADENEIATDLTIALTWDPQESQSRSHHASVFSTFVQTFARISDITLVGSLTIASTAS